MTRVSPPTAMVAVQAGVDAESAMHAVQHKQCGPHLLGIGTALPRYRWPQTQIEDVLADLWSLRGAARMRWQRICRGTQIEQRFSVALPEEIINCSTAQRMEIFEREAPALSLAAAQSALQQADMNAKDITDLIVVTCTGFAAPGLDVAILDQLGCAASVRRVQIGYMGCFGAITGLRTALGMCAADPAARVLMVCCELCTLHVRRDADVNNQIASALFGDGAAAVVLAGEDAVAASPHSALPVRNPSLRLTSGTDGHPPHANEQRIAPHPSLGCIGLGGSLLLPHGRSWMTWRITDHGFAMTLDRRVPDAMRETIRTEMPELCDRAAGTLLVHPGGPGVLDAVAQAANLSSVGDDDGQTDAGLSAARAVLRACGNVSSGTILFVLQRALQTGLQPPFTLLAFGPGLTIEYLPIWPAPAVSS